MDEQQHEKDNDMAIPQPDYPKHPPGTYGDRLANEIANRLFVNGFGEEAERLVLVCSGGSGGKSQPPDRNLGGWCKEAVVDKILDAIRAVDACEQGKSSRPTKKQPPPAPENVWKGIPW